MKDWYFHIYKADIIAVIVYSILLAIDIILMLILFMKYKNDRGGIAICFVPTALILALGFFASAPNAIRTISNIKPYKEIDNQKVAYVEVYEDNTDTYYNKEKGNDKMVVYYYQGNILKKKELSAKYINADEYDEDEGHRIKVETYSTGELTVTIPDKYLVDYDKEIRVAPLLYLSTEGVV